MTKTETASEEKKEEHVAPKIASKGVEVLLHSMSTKEKIAQLLVPSFNVGDEGNEWVSSVIAEYDFGGLLFYSYNCKDEESTMQLISEFQTGAGQSVQGIPMLMMVDQEGGKVEHVEFLPHRPGNSELAEEDVKKTRENAKLIGTDLRNLGFNTNLAPVVDVNSNPKNPVIGKRAFSDDPKVVSEYAKEAINGYHDSGIITCTKHYPGHGDTDVDSHTGLPIINKSKRELNKVELIPFLDTSEYADIVMTAHICFPKVEKETYESISTNERITLPATMSYTLIEETLRRELGFGGVVITDALNMDAITKHFEPMDVARLSLNAGVDMLLMPFEISEKNGSQKIEDYIGGIETLIEEGSLSIERVNEAVTRILNLKLKYGIIKEDMLEPVLGNEQFDEYVPLLQGKRVAVLSNHTGIVGDKPGGEHIIDALIERGVNLTAIFSPEHGFRGDISSDTQIKDYTDEKTGLPVYSLYEYTTIRPKEESLETFDTLVVDIQDVGLRYYTYYIAMYYMMEACAGKNKDIIILDRPNPNGFYVDGPILRDEFKSGVGALPVPVVHGLTWGELALMINGEGWLNTGANSARLTVIPCKNYNHMTKYEVNIAPSPNLSNMRAIYLYSSLCFFENTLISVGRGTNSPFEIYGCPYFEGMEEYSYSFVPKSSEKSTNPKYEGETCYGVNLTEKPYEEIWAEGIDLSYLIKCYNMIKEYDSSLEFFGKSSEGKSFVDLLFGTDSVRILIEEGKSEEEIEASWAEDVEKFKEQRRPYLLYKSED